MSCPGLDALMKYVRNELSSDETKRIQRHADVCDQCRQEIESLQLEAILEELDWDKIAQATPRGECLNTTMLAAFLDKKLDEPQRETAKDHLASCRTCLDELVSLAERIDAVSEAWQPAPSHLLERAKALGAPVRAEQAAVPSPLQELARRVEGWSEFLTPKAMLGLATVAVCAVVAISFLLTRSNLSSLITVDLAQEKELKGTIGGPAFNIPKAVVKEATVPLSPRLKKALLAYYEQPAIEQRVPLIQILAKEPYEVPAEKVSKIEIEQSLIVKIESGKREVSEVIVKLFQGGLLVIADKP